MRLSLVQMNSKTASRDENVERACVFVDEAARRRPDLVVLPEFFNVEYFPHVRSRPRRAAGGSHASTQ